MTRSIKVCENRRTTSDMVDRNRKCFREIGVANHLERQLSEKMKK